MTSFNLLHTFSIIVTSTCDILINKSSLNCWLSQRDVTELQAADNAITCLYQPCEANALDIKIGYGYRINIPFMERRGRHLSTP